MIVVVGKYIVYCSNIVNGEYDVIGIGNEGDVGKIFCLVRLFRCF